MNPAPQAELIPAATIDLATLDLGPPEVRAQFMTLHRLVLEVCPDCLINRNPRGDNARIYVPRERCTFRIHKNLITVWTPSTGVLIHLYDGVKNEAFEAGQVEDYRTRLRARYNWMLTL